jgi:hypothetical protein
MTDLLRLPLILVAFAKVFLPIMAVLVVLIVIQDLPELRARAHQRRIARSEARVRHLEGQLHRAKTNLATLRRPPPCPSP